MFWVKYENLLNLRIPFMYARLARGHSGDRDRVHYVSGLLRPEQVNR